MITRDVTLAHARVARAQVCMLGLALQRTLARHYRRFARFGVVGALGVLVNTGLLFVLVHVGRLPTLLAAALATELTILTNFTLNDRWTFGDAASGLSRMGRAARYNAIALGGLGLQLAVLAALLATVHLYYLIANLVAIGAAMLWNYAVNARCTWSLPAGDAPLARSRPARAPWMRHYLPTLTTKER